MKVIENILNPELAKSLYSLASDTIHGVYRNVPEYNVNTWTSNMWPSFLTEGSAPVIVYNILGEAQHAIIDNLIEKGVFTDEQAKVAHTEFSTMIYVWLRHSYINRHTDSHANMAVTIYLNPEWNFEEGGHFQWQDPASLEWKTLIPSFNTGVINDKGYAHATTPVTSLKQYRYSFQGFFGRKD